MKTNDLYSESSRAPTKRIQPDEGPGAVVARTFAVAGAAATYPVGTPLYAVAATGLLAKLDPSAAFGNVNDIFAFVYPYEVTVSATATEEVLGTVMLKGSIHFEELEALRVAGVLAGTNQQLKDVCRKPAVSARDIHIEGLTRIGGNAGIVA